MLLVFICFVVFFVVLGEIVMGRILYISVSFVFILCYKFIIRVKFRGCLGLEWVLFGVFLVIGDFG